jgi:two-component system response regulator AtoC
MELINKVAPIDLTVLITGESGTGKELTASAIHQKSKRNKEPFVKVNCAAIPETLLESELFGHEKGAFTGAHERRIGKFELAHQGTIFMDEIGDMTPATQAKILRLLEQKELERVGGKETLKIDVRVIAATNQDLTQAINEKKFREDLYFRLNVFHIILPPLRDRKEDIPILVDHFIHEANLRLGKEISGISADAMKILLDYQWRGNVRELKNSIERAVALTEADFITSDVIALSFKETEAGSDLNTPETPMSLSNTLEEVERQLIFDALLKTGAVQVEAAKLLGITEKNLWKKIKKHKIDPKEMKKEEKEDKALKQV